MKNHRAFLEQTIIPNIANNTERLARYWQWQLYNDPWMGEDGYAIYKEKRKHLFKIIAPNGSVIYDFDERDY